MSWPRIFKNSKLAEWGVEMIDKISNSMPYFMEAYLLRESRKSSHFWRTESVQFSVDYMTICAFKGANCSIVRTVQKFVIVSKRCSVRCKCTIKNFTKVCMTTIINCSKWLYVYLNKNSFQDKWLLYILYIFCGRGIIKIKFFIILNWRL